MSSGQKLNPRLFLTHPVTRTAMAEALVSMLVLEPPVAGMSDDLCITNDLCITKMCLFGWITKFDPLASIMSYNASWDDLVGQVTKGAASTDYINGDAAIKIRPCDVQHVIQSVLSDIRGGSYEYMDKRDECLRHLFQEERPILPEIPFRMDMYGRLMTGADEHLKRLVEVMEPLSKNIGEVLAHDVYQKHYEERFAAIQAQLDQLRAAQQPIQLSQKKEITMAERIVKAATETGTGVLSAIQEGGKISLSQKANQSVVTLFHKHLGKHIPGATSPVGKKVEAIAIPAILHFGASAFSDKIPHVDVVQRACLRAITGESKDGMDDVLEVLMPIFKEIVSAEGIVGEAMKELAGTEVTKIEPASAVPQLEEHEVHALTASLLEQLRNAPRGQPVEIKLTLPARVQEEAQQLVPPFEK